MEAAAEKAIVWKLLHAQGKLQWEEIVVDAHPHFGKLQKEELCAEVESRLQKLAKVKSYCRGKFHVLQGSA